MREIEMPDPKISPAPCSRAFRQPCPLRGRHPQIRPPGAVNASLHIMAVQLRDLNSIHKSDVTVKGNFDGSSRITETYKG